MISGNRLMLTRFCSGVGGLVWAAAIRIFAICVALWACGAAAFAEQVPVKASEIRQMLTGNTIQGTWYGDEYRQYFYEDGKTIYAPRNSKSAAGRWRVNEAENTYESWWERTGWESYRVVEEDGRLFWLGEGNRPEPFFILPGEQLVWKEEE